MKVYPGLRGEVSTHVRIYNPPDILKADLFRLLTFKNPEYENAQRYSPWESSRIPETECLAEEYEDHIKLPRGLTVKGLLPEARKIWDAIPFKDLRTSFPVDFPKLHITPNKDQVKMMDRFRASLEEADRPFGTNLFVAPTSAGKTIAQGLIAGLTGERTLVLCKSSLIKKAWIDDMYLAYGMNEKDDLGLIQRKSFKLGDHVTLAMIATLSRRKEAWPELFSNIGCLIIDEVQILGARTIREIVEACPAKYIIGMTATPTRRDGKSYIVNNYVGTPLLRILNKQEETENSFPLADAEVVQTAFRFDDKKGIPIDRDDLDPHQLFDALTKDKARNALLIDKVRRDYVAGHSILITTPRVAHVTKLAAMLTKAGIPAKVLSGDTNSDKFYTDTLVASLLARKCRCLVASTQAIKLGANINTLSRLHIFGPVLNCDDLEQLIGRIRRKYKGKKDAKLTYYYDIEVPYLHRKFKSVFFPVMRKLKVPKYENLYVA